MNENNTLLCSLSKNKEKLELGKLILAGILRFENVNLLAKAAYRPYKDDKIRFKTGISSTKDSNPYIKAKV